MTTLTKAPKIVIAALNGAKGNLTATRYTFKNKKAHDWLTKNLGLVTDDNEHVVCGYVVNFDWTTEQWYVNPFANVEQVEEDTPKDADVVAPEVTESDAATDKPKKVSMCSAIRAAALEWKGTRTEFINAWHEAQGVHKGTLGTQWAKAHREGK